MNNINDSVVNVMSFLDMKSVLRFAITNTRYLDTFREYRDQITIDYHPVLHWLNSSSFVNRYNKVDLYQYLQYGKKIHQILVGSNQDDKILRVQSAANNMLDLPLPAKNRRQFCSMVAIFSLFKEMTHASIPFAYALNLAAILRNDGPLLQKIKTNDNIFLYHLAIMALAFNKMDVFAEIFAQIVMNEGFNEKIAQLRPIMFGLGLEKKQYDVCEAMLASDPLYYQDVLFYFVQNNDFARLEKILNYLSMNGHPISSQIIHSMIRKAAVFDAKKVLDLLFRKYRQEIQTEVLKEILVLLTTKNDQFFTENYYADTVTNLEKTELQNHPVYLVMINELNTQIIRREPEMKILPVDNLPHELEPVPLQPMGILEEMEAGGFIIDPMDEDPN